MSTANWGIRERRGGIKSCRGGLSKYTPPHISLKKVFWPKWGGGGGGYKISPWIRGFEKGLAGGGWR